MTANGTKLCRWVPKWVKKPAKKIRQFFLCSDKTKKSEEFAVTIEPFERDDKQTMGEEEGEREDVFSPPLEPLTLAAQLECLFRRYFQRRVDHFAMTNVRSERSAFGRYRQIRHAKQNVDHFRQIVSSMVEFWEEQRQHERLLMGRTNERREGPIDALMDSYFVFFACLYDFFARSAHVLEEFYPQLKKDDGGHSTVRNPPSFDRRHYAKRHRKHFSDIGTSEQLGFRERGSLVNFVAKNSYESETEKCTIRRYKNNRPKSIVCYF